MERTPNEDRDRDLWQWCLAGMQPDRLFMGKCTHVAIDHGGAEKLRWDEMGEESVIDYVVQRVRLVNVMVFNVTLVPAQTKDQLGHVGLTVQRVNTITPLAACGYGATIDISPTIITWFSRLEPEDAWEHLRLHGAFMEQQLKDRAKRSGLVVPP